MSNFRAWVEKTRNGGYVVRHEMPDGSRVRDYLLQKDESGMVDGKLVIGKNLANRLCEKVRLKYYSTELGVVVSDEPVLPLIERFIAEREANNYQPTTLTHNRNSLTRLFVDNNLRSISGITNEVLRNWKYNMTRRGWAVETIRGCLADTSTFLNWLVEIGKLKASPFGKNMLPQKKDAEPKYWTAAEFDALDKDLATRHYPTRILCDLANGAGLRKEEALGVTWEDIIWNADGTQDLLIRKEIAKGKKKSAVIPLDAGLMEVLGSRQSGPLVQATKNQIDHYFKMSRKAIGVRKELTIHGLRHTFAKNHLQSGKGNLNSLMKLMRHSTFSSVQIYAQFERAFFREAVDETYRQQLIARKLAGQNAGTSILRGRNTGKNPKSLDVLIQDDTARDCKRNSKDIENTVNSDL